MNTHSQKSLRLLRSKMLTPEGCLLGACPLHGLQVFDLLLDLFLFFIRGEVWSYFDSEAFLTGFHTVEYTISLLMVGRKKEQYCSIRLKAGTRGFSAD